MMKRVLAALVVAGVATAAAAGQARPVVRVAAASDLRFALEQAAAELASRRSPIRLAAVYGSSGNLYAQLRQRAPYDLFLSADIAYPADLVAHGVGAKADLFTYARGRLAVWVGSTSALPIERDGLRALAGARRVAIANPAHAPYGRAAEAALRGAGLWDAVRPRLLLAENIAQAAQFVQSGAADAGVIARSLAVAAPMRAAGRYTEIPAEAHPPLTQGGLIPAQAANRGGALAVRDYLLSPDGQALLARNGFDAAGAR